MLSTSISLLFLPLIWILHTERYGSMSSRLCCKFVAYATSLQQNFEDFFGNILPERLNPLETVTHYHVIEDLNLYHYACSTEETFSGNHVRISWKFWRNLSTLLVELIMTWLGAIAISRLHVINEFTRMLYISVIILCVLSCFENEALFKCFIIITMFFVYIRY